MKIVENDSLEQEKSVEKDRVGQDHLDNDRSEQQF
jgi:hypothetical protein